MNTTPITAAVTNNPTGADQARKRDGSAADEGFSTVMGDQQAALSPTTAAAPAVSHHGEGSHKRGTDAELAENATEQGLAVGAGITDATAAGVAGSAPISARTLPQVALALAAEIADIQRGVKARDQERLAGQTVGQDGADGAASEADKKASRDVADAASLRFGPALRAGELRNRPVAATSDRASTDMADIRRAGASQQRAGTDGILATGAAVSTRGAASILTESQMPTAAGANLVGPGKAASIAGAKQAVLAMQARMQAADAAQQPNWQSAGGTVFNFNDPLARAFADLPAYLGVQPESTPVDGHAALFATGMNAAPNTSLASLNFPVSSHGAVATSINTPQWGADFTRQFVTLTQNGQTGDQIAELRLDPPELGPLRISINISDNVAHALFVSPHASVRQSVENSLAQLQQALSDAGISLGQANVSDEGQHAEQAFNESLRGGPARGNGASTSGGSAVDAATAPATRRAPAADALVDTFA